MSRNGFLAVGLLLSSLLAGGAAAGANAEEKPFDPNRGGMVLRAVPERVVGGGCRLTLAPEVVAPVLGTTVQVHVAGVVARTRVTQVFANPTQEWMTGTYLFPLPDGAAVDALRLVVGDRVTEGEVQETAAAQATFEAAAREGRTASLLDQVRPGLFTTSVANIGPGESIEVEIEMQQVVRYERGRFVLHFPMLAAPRFAPASLARGAERGIVATAAWHAEPAIPEPPLAFRPVNPFAFHVDLVPGFPLGRVGSPTHPIAAVADRAQKRWAVDLAAGFAFADSDFVLEWVPAVGRAPRAVYFSEEVDGERYALLMMMPPDDGEALEGRLPRETIFVVDTSGSMEGEAMEQARRALHLALARLVPGDWFNVIGFDSDTVTLFPDSVPADPAAREEARRFVAGLAADGGTEMLPAIERALQGGVTRGDLVQQVIFVTDGQVTNEAQILRFLPQGLGGRRLFTVALGTAPNVAFLRRAAELGRGSFTHIPGLGQVTAGMAELFARLEAPMLRQIEIAWSDPAAEAWPARVPDLYLGEPLVVAARLRDAGAMSAAGLHSGGAWREELPAATEIVGAGLDKLWAGRKIAALMDGREEGADAETVRREVIALGLAHHLVTPYTSLVAVDLEAAAPPGVAPVAGLVPLNRPRASFDTMVATGSSGGGGGGGVEEMITVTSQSPLVDARAISTGTTIRQSELHKIPGARDPWAVLAAVPGVLTDRVNAGGSESGRQAAVAAGGAAAEQGQVEIDGATVSSLAAPGSPGAYDFDTFTELEVTTGGADVTLEAPGPRLRLLRSRGSNTWRGSGFALWSDGSEAADRAAPDAAGAPTNRLDGLRVVDAEWGGPLRLDQAWIWVHAGRDEVESAALGGQLEERRRTSGGAKLDLQPTNDISVALAWTRGDAGGSGSGAGPTRAPATTLEEEAQDDLWKAEATHVVSSRFFVIGRVAGTESRLREEPRQPGGVTIDRAGLARGSWFGHDEERRTRDARLTTSFFTSPHELSLGASWRRLDEARALALAGPVVVAGESLGLGEGLVLAELWRGDGTTQTETQSVWAQDLVTHGPFLATFGLRADRQDLGLPHGATPWTPAPRLGLTWDRSGEGTTVVRASLGRFASRLGARAAWHADPGAPGALLFRLPAVGGELAAVPGLVGPWSGEGLDPLHPGLDPDAVAAHLAPALTDEAALGVSQLLDWNFAVGLRATWRRSHRLLEERLLVRDLTTGQAFVATAGDWLPAGRLTGTLPDGSAYDVPYWDLRPGLASTGGHLLTNGDRRQDDLGLTAYWERRHAGRWMSRGHLTWHGGEQRLGRDFRRFDDPTNTLGSGDDEELSLAASGSGRPHEAPRFLSTRWSFHASGLVELGRGFSLAGAVNGREGYPLAYYRTVARERAGLARVQLGSRPDAHRGDELVTLDGRLDKEISLGDARITLGVEGFNLLDEDTVVERQLDLGVTRGGLADEALVPRTFRVGVRLEWR